MKRFIFLLALAFLSVTAFSQYDWQALPSAPTTEYRFDDVYFLNPKIGWAVKPIGGAVHLGQIWETRNGGNTWALNHDSSQTYYRCVGFIDSLHGWIGNLGDTSISNDTIPLYYTHDGGKHLIPVNLPSPRPKGICGISIASDSVIYAYGRYFSPPVLCMTKDAGKTWVTKDMSAYASVGLIDGWFWSKDTGFITGQDSSNAVILHTTDGGNTWTTVYHAHRNDSDHVWKMVFPSRDTGYGALEVIKSKITNTYFVKTTDGGKTWTEYPFIYGYDEEGVGFINDTVGWIGGWSGLSFITTNGGSTWKLDSSFGVMTIGQPYPEPYMNRFRKFGDTLMYGAGNTIYKLDTRITGINGIKNSKSFLTNYPNPFIGETTIAYILQRPCRNVTLQVTDVTGKKILFKNLGMESVGQHTYTLTDKLPAGTYTCTLVTSDAVLNRKIVVVK
jgi:photosystem II stability/assembly factor-like uncharacterized protein